MIGKGRKRTKLTYDEWGLLVVWLTWALRDNGQHELRAVSLTQTHAGYVRKDAQQSKGVIRAVTERRQAEHMFGSGVTARRAAIKETIRANRGEATPSGTEGS